MSFDAVRSTARSSTLPSTIQSSVTCLQRPYTAEARALTAFLGYTVERHVRSLNAVQGFREPPNSPLSPLQELDFEDIFYCRPPGLSKLLFQRSLALECAPEHTQPKQSHTSSPQEQIIYPRQEFTDIGYSTPAPTSRSPQSTQTTRMVCAEVEPEGESAFGMYST